MNRFIFLLLFLPVNLFSQNLDIKLLRQINEHRNTHLDGTFKTISNSVSPISVGVPILIFGTGLIEKNQELKQKGLVVAESFLVTTLVATGLKHAVNRTRPYETYPDIQKLSAGGNSSFPSGHTSDAFSMATSLSLEFPHWYVIAPSYTYAALVGYSRMHLGVHYPSDVLAGAVVGAGSAFLCYKVQKWLNHRNRKKHR